MVHRAPTGLCDPQHPRLLPEKVRWVTPNLFTKSLFTKSARASSLPHARDSGVLLGELSRFLFYFLGRISKPNKVQAFGSNTENSHTVVLSQ